MTTKYPTGINVLRSKANLRVNLFSPGVFSSSELSSVGKQRWYKEQGSMDSETHRTILVLEADTSKIRQEALESMH